MIKKNLLLVIFFFLSFTTKNYAHKEWVHQYITREAYRLLASYLGMGIPEMRSQLAFDVNLSPINGVYGRGNSTRPWEYGPALSVGVYREDLHDAVWQRNGMGTVSATHFWKGDYPQDYLIDLGPFAGPKNPNAFYKARYYAFGRDMNATLTKGYIALEGDYSGERWHPRNFPTSIPGSDYRKFISYTNIFDLYSTGRYFYHGGEYGFHMNFLLNHEFMTNPQEAFFDIVSRKKYGYNLLARIAHLLQDMGVPAHVHGDTHACDEPIRDGDTFELYVAGSLIDYGWFGPSCNTERNQFIGTTWNYQTAQVDELSLNGTSPMPNGGLLLTKDQILSMGDSEVLRYLFYVLNQISDVFSSWDQEGDIDDDAYGNTHLPISMFSNATVYVHNIYWKLKEKYKPDIIFPDNASPKRDDLINFGERGVNTITPFHKRRGDVLMNYAIRATATLLYWFQIRANVPTGGPAELPRVAIRGEHSLRSGRTATLYAIPDGEGSGVPNLTYQWMQSFLDEYGNVIPSSTTIIPSVANDPAATEVTMPSIDDVKGIQVSVTVTGPNNYSATNIFNINRYFGEVPVPTVAALKSPSGEITDKQTTTATTRRAMARGYKDDLQPQMERYVVSDKATLKFTSAEASSVTIDVLNGKYSKLLSLSTEAKERGKQTQHINTSSLDNGAYIIRIMAKDSKDPSITHRSFMPLYVKR